MKIFSVHFILTIIAALSIHSQIEGLFSGIMEFCIYLGIMFLLWLSSASYSHTYFRQFFHSVLLFFYFTKELVVSNLEIIYYVITPGLQFQSAVLELPLDVKSDFAITLLANLITLTPGTLTLDISTDKRFLYFHAINVPDGDIVAAKRKVKDGFEKHILAITK